LDLSRNMLWYSCLIKHAKTLLGTKDCCTYSLLHAQQDALTQYKDLLHISLLFEKSHRWEVRRHSTPFYHNFLLFKNWRRLMRSLCCLYVYLTVCPCLYLSTCPCVFPNYWGFWGLWGPFCVGLSACLFLPSPIFVTSHVMSPSGLCPSPFYFWVFYAVHLVSKESRLNLPRTCYFVSWKKEILQSGQPKSERYSNRVPSE
jgi:hypothetical protein